MTPQQLIAALDAFQHAVRAQSAISKFPEGGLSDATPFNRWNTPPHHNARPPGKVRKHKHRHRFHDWFAWLHHGMGAHNTMEPQPHPEPDGA